MCGLTYCYCKGRRVDEEDSHTARGESVYPVGWPYQTVVAETVVEEAGDQAEKDALTEK